MTLRNSLQLPLLASLLGLITVTLPADGQDAAVKQDKQDTKVELRKEAMNKILQKAQEDYRTFFKEPKTALEFWAAATFEINVGKFDVAAYLIDNLLKVPEKEGDEDLLKIEAAEGMRAFLRLRLVKEWSKNPEVEAEARKNVDILNDRVVAALDRFLGNRERILQLVQSLYDKLPEVRDYAIVQLARTKYRAAPVLAEVLRNGKPQEVRAVKNALAHLDPDIMPPLLELYRAHDAKDAADVEFRLNLLWLAKVRMEKRVIPYLWHMSSATIYPKIVREEARDTLAYLLDTRPDQLQSAKVALTQIAEQYLQYKVRMPNLTEVADRDDPSKQLAMPAYKKWFLNEDGRLKDTPDVLKPDDARLEFGLLFARQALELDPGYLQAQAVYLALLLEAAYNRKPYEGQLDKLTTQPSAPAVQRLLGKIDLDLLTTALERATDDQNYAVMLPLIDAAAQRGEVRLAQSATGGAAGLLGRLLYYPDRRVQFAAARALLKMPTSQSPAASARIVDVLSRFLMAEPAPRVLIVFAKDERAAQLRNAAKEAGYESDVAATVRDAIALVHTSASHDAILIDDRVSERDLQYALAQLRADQDAGRLPLMLIASSAKQSEMAVKAQQTRNTFVLPEATVSSGPELKRKLEDAIKFAASPESLRHAPEGQQVWLRYEVRRAKGQALSETERKQFARDSLDWFAQMARGELPGYDLLPAKYALLHALNNEEMAPQALRIMARYSTVEAQQRLAAILLDKNRAGLHILAAQELNRSIQRNGLVLNNDQINLLRQLEQQAEVPPPLQVELAILVGTLRTTPNITGTRLLNYGPGQ